MKSWKKFLSAALAVSLFTTSMPALAEDGAPRAGDMLDKPFSEDWLDKKCEGFSAEVQSIQVKGQEQRHVPAFLRAKPALNDLVETRVKFTNNNYDNGLGTTTQADGEAHLVGDPLVMKNGQAFTIEPRPVLEWSNPDKKKNFILGHGDSVTFTYRHIVTEDDLANRSVPEGPNYPISNSPSSVPACVASPGVVYGWSSLANALPGLVDFFRSIFLFFRR
ncbi:hypothetical protein [Corynebacterium ulcerans]|uniref:hypothetical protein n=1 Tax=Corynebacterium ulcerans TaxID=65058 RepID=UPI0005FEAE93|nr:hypothetical protein [Corynebacterium ulcerans]AKA96227.1 Hypothetical protein CUL131002_0683 [Corynebacterium ulcerans]